MPDLDLATIAERASSRAKDTLLPGGRAWIEEAMRERGLDLVATAEAFGVEPEHMERVMAGREPLSPVLTERVADFLTVSPWVMETLKHDSSPPSPFLRSLLSNGWNGRVPPIGEVQVLGDLTAPVGEWDDDGDQG